MATLLLDPAFLLVPNGKLADEWIQFWGRLADWHGDNRVKIGIATSQAETIWTAVNDPRLNFPPHCIGDRARIVGKLMSRVLAHHGLEPITKIEPAYLAVEGARELLFVDIRHCGANAGGPIGIATSVHNWASHSQSAECVPPPPHLVELCFEPNAPISEELRERAMKALSGLRLNIIGGNREDRIFTRLEDRLGIKREQVNWEASEKNRNPKLSGWGNLHSERDVAICITGFISHSAKIKASAFADRAGVKWIDVERPSEIVEELEKQFGCAKD